MRISSTVILGFILLFFAGGTTANILIGPNKNPLAPEVTIVLAEFGLFNPLETGEELFVVSRKVPLKENQSFGWVIILGTKKPIIRWREEMTLPAAPVTWGSVEPQDGRIITNDRRTSIIEREVMPYQGLISHSWVVAPGDPKGHYIIRIIVENRLQEVFEFDVE